MDWQGREMVSRNNVGGSVGKNEDGEKRRECELSLSLSLPNQSSKRSNAISNTNHASSSSEMSEAISFISCSSSGNDTINLDLSIALCGN